MKIEEIIETLTRLGLTLDQSRAYLALIKSGPATAKTLSKNTYITQQDIYRVMPALEKTGIAERLITKPISFQALPAEQAIHILLDRKNIEQKELKIKTEKMLNHIKTYRANNANKSIQENTLFAMIPGKENIIQRLIEELEKTHTSLDVVTSQKRFSSSIFVFAEGYQRAVKRGVNIRIAAEKPQANKRAQKIVLSLQKSGHFEVRHIQEPPQAIFAVFDMKEVYITLSAKTNLTGVSGIWSNNACFIALAQNYFETKWSNATTQGVC